MQTWLKMTIPSYLLYETIQQLPPACFTINGKYAPNPDFWTGFSKKIVEISSVYASCPIEDKCNTDPNKFTHYTLDSKEITMLISGLISLYWFKENLARKTNNGHCNNPLHDSREEKPSNCSIGRNFHKELYDDFLKIIENFLKEALEYVQNNNPKKLDVANGESIHE